jgi:hypothetical protein
VVEHGRLTGMVSIGDLNPPRPRTSPNTIGFLEAYIQARGVKDRSGRAP